MKHQRVTSESPTESGLDRPLFITKYPDARARSKSRIRTSLRDLAGKLPDRIAASKSELPLLKLARTGDQRTAKGSLRSNANMLTIEGVEGDYDGECMSVADAAKQLRKAGIAALIYTSPSHRPGKPRWRVLCPTSRPLPPAERESLIARVNGVLGGELSPESFTLSQSFYYGSVEGQAPADVELVDGGFIDLAHELDAGALDKHGKPYGAADEPEEDDEDDDLRGEPDLARIRKALAVIPSDERETWRTVGQALHHEFGGDDEGYELWADWSQSSDKFDDDDQRRVWESFGRYDGRPVTIGTIFRMAKLHRPKVETFGELRFLSTEECTLAPPRGYIVKGLIAPRDVACIFGAPGAGKSLIAPHIGYQVALGEPAFAMRAKPGRVFYVAVEDAHGMRNRIAALAIRQGHAPLFQMVEGVADIFAEDSADLEALAEAVEEQRPALIFIDTLAMAFPGLEENDAKGMGRVVAVCRQLTEHGAAVVLIHHDTKAEGSTPRGHSVLNGALDMAMHVKRDDDGIVRGKLTKNRNGTPDRNIAFRIGIEELGRDEDGDPITAALVEELTGSDPVRRIRLTAGEQAALAKLMELETDGSVTEEEWRDACVDERKVSGSEDRESRKRAMRRAVQGLAKKGLIDTRDGIVTLREVTSQEED